MKRKTVYYGIYEVKNLINGKSYIGQSAQNVHGRCTSHIGRLRRNHDNRHLVNAVNKYGIENFSFKVILYCEKFELTRYENELIECDRPNRYNIRPAADSNVGIRLSEQHRYKIQESWKTRRLVGISDETRRKISESHKTVNLSDETRRKISASLIGNTRLKGYVPTEETRYRLSESGKGKHRNIVSAETRRKLSEAQKLRFSRDGMSEESKRKMSEGQKRRRQREYDNKVASLVCEEVICEH